LFLLDEDSKGKAQSVVAEKDQEELYRRALIRIQKQDCAEMKSLRVGDSKTPSCLLNAKRRGLLSRKRRLSDGGGERGTLGSESETATSPSRVGAACWDGVKEKKMCDSG